MGLFQSHVRYCGCFRIARLSSLTKAITVYSLAHAMLALKAASETERPVLLISAPFAAGTTGPAWFQSVVSQAMEAVPEADASSMLDFFQKFMFLINFSLFFPNIGGQTFVKKEKDLS